MGPGVRTRTGIRTTYYIGRIIFVLFCCVVDHNKYPHKRRLSSGSTVGPGVKYDMFPAPLQKCPSAMGHTVFACGAAHIGLLHVIWGLQRVR
jgi:hypothetical protein